MRFLVPNGRLGVVWRAVLAAIIIVGCAAGAVATAGLLQVNTIVGDITVHPGIKSKQLHIPKPGKPETILVIGSDHRFGESYRTSNTDTMLLLRLNSASSTINVMSIPRDLEVDIPGYGTSKLNAAYSLGSYSLLLQTIRQDVFPHLQVNHIIDTNFKGFSDIVDAIGCVYSDVDHRYYNLSQPYPSPDNYSSIDIQPGYQKLCGHNQSVHGALPFVRFRHTDSDFVREARQQDFLRWAKQGFPISKLLSERDKLLKILGRNSTFDKNLQSSDALIELFDLVAFSDGDSIKQIKFPGTPTVVGDADVVVSSAAQEAEAFHQFMHPTPKSSSASRKKPALSAHGRRRHHAAALNTSGLSPDPADGIEQAKALTHPGMPVYYPRLIATDSDYCFSTTGNCNNPDESSTAYEHSYPRQYLIPTTDGTKVHAYRMTLAINALLGEYYGIQGVRWKDPPLLQNAAETKTVHGRKLYLYAGDGGHITTVAFHIGENTYWVSNDLTSDLPNSEMVAIAASMVRFRG
jgi:polyisoprenyl-teichoic acid--peptidoglycan teichoic acid transferase